MKLELRGKMAWLVKEYAVWNERFKSGLFLNLLRNHGIMFTLVWVCIGLTWGISSLVFEKEFGTNELGDYFAGWFSPLAFGWFVYTVYMQKQELSQTNTIAEKQAVMLEKQFKTQDKQTFENTFFALVNSFMNIIEGMNYHDPEDSKKPDLKGRNALQKISRNLRDGFDPIYNVYSLAMDEKSKPQLQTLTEFIEFYDDQWNTLSRQCLSHYFRMMNRIFQFVDNNSYFHYRKKREYISFLRSHLSDDELMLFLFNTMHHYGKAMLYFVVKYDLFDNFPTKMLPEQQYVHDHIDNILNRSEQVNRLLAEQEKKMEHKEDYKPLHDSSFLSEIDFIAHGAYVNEGEIEPRHTNSDE